LISHHAFWMQLHRLSTDNQALLPLSSFVTMTETRRQVCHKFCDCDLAEHGNHGTLRCINLNMMGEQFSRGLLNTYVLLTRASLLQEITLSFCVNQKTCESDWKDFVASLTNLSATLQKVNVNLHVDSVINNSGIEAFRDAIMTPSYFISPHVKFNLTMLENGRPVEFKFPEFHQMHIDLNLSQGVRQIICRSSAKHDILWPQLIVRANAAD
jgi:hypothetical protein